ncbi:unnamed protein product [Prunus armeniaca]|uniref:Uncharacterized protein n=1 Tax=Prunus armeniaca TaxID=36596 RepID=A0A6J5TL58_PRUAR|nr:unnamed protein product [Prunus armeniaca]
MLNTASEVRYFHNFRGTIVRLVSWHTSPYVSLDFGGAVEGDILYIIKPLDYYNVRDILLHTLKKKDNEVEHKHQDEEKKMESTKSRMNVKVEHEASVTITNLTPQLVMAPIRGMWVVQFYEDLFGARLIRYNKFEPQHLCALKWRLDHTNSSSQTRTISE